MSNGISDSDRPTGMHFPGLGEYYADGAPSLGGSTKICDQPATQHEFIFGMLPEGLKDKYAKTHEGKPLRIGVIGAGGVYTTFMRGALDHLGIERYILDTNPELSFKLNSLEKRVTSQDELVESGLDYIVISTPPDLHPGPLRWAQQQGVPVMVEKPIVALGAHFTGDGGLHARLQKGGTSPIYAMDWEVLVATPFFAAAGVKSAFHDSVKFGNDGADKEAFKQFDLKNVVSIDARYVEGGDNKLCDPAVFFNRGGWLFDKNKGGGTLYDMMVHPMNTLAAMGFIPGRVESALLGTPKTLKDEKGEVKSIVDQGTFEKVGKNSREPVRNREGEVLMKGKRPVTRDVAEWYGRAKFISNYNGRGIPTTVETAKFAQENDQVIKLTDRNGNKLVWKLGVSPDKSLTDLGEREKSVTSVVTLEDKSGKVLATASGCLDPYGLMFDEATRFFEAEKLAKENDSSHLPVGLYYKEHRAVLEALDNIHQLGRSVEVKEGEKVLQQSVEERNGPPGTMVMLDQTRGGPTLDQKNRALS